MKVVIMAGGAGSRLRPLTIKRPKPMVPIVNKPIIYHIVELLKRHGVTDVIITVQYLAEMIQNYFGNGSNFGMNIQYSIEEVPLGTAGSVKNVQDLLDDTFLVISGDALTNFNLTKIVTHHKNNKALATLALYKLADPLDYGVVTLNQQGHISRFQEKPSRGLVMSDYVNTGIYVLEPEVLNHIETDAPFDFANDLFPLLQKRGYSLNGYVSEGYWCDVGNISQYIHANADALEGRVEGIDLGNYLGKGIWAGHEVEISPGARLEGPIYLGDAVQIKEGAVIRGPTIIRDYTVVDNWAHIDCSILWRNCYVGKGVQINGAVILRQCSLKSNVTVFEGAVIGDSTIVAEGAIIHPNVKIWPNKEIEPGATVNSSIIWGSQGRRVLFGRYGISGIVNVDLTPEFSAKLGATFGATLPKGSIVTINRDIHRSPQMIKRAIISGLPSAGINVWDLKSQPVPVAHYYTRVCEATGGVHVCLSPYDQRVVDIYFMDSMGLSLSESRQRGIEHVFFREDFRRVYLNDIGSIEYPQQVKERYINDFLTHLNTKAIQGAGFNLVVDFANSTVADVLPIILDVLDCNTVALNANIDRTKTPLDQIEFQASLKQLQVIAQALGTRLGVCLDGGGEKIFLVDERGYLLEGITACAAMVDLALRDAPGSTVAIPIDLPNLFEEIAMRHNGHVIRAETDPNALIKAAHSHNVIMAGDGNGHFIFPDFQYAVDGLMALAKILEFIATQNISLGEVVSGLPTYHVSHRKVPCVWESKARVMRLLNERFQDNKDQAVNGVKINLDSNRWVLIMPDPAQPCFRITTESASRNEAEILADEYAQIVAKITPLE